MSGNKYLLNQDVTHPATPAGISKITSSEPLIYADGADFTDALPVCAGVRVQSLWMPSHWLKNPCNSLNLCESAILTMMQLKSLLRHVSGYATKIIENTEDTWEIRCDMQIVFSVETKIRIGLGVILK